ncbi:unnamed protein product [Echinostoma caproni]|uniref:ULP_PROTEASE domain-containing protein n=1 Tax=Echinostoma caproni TaxID=27848 RepID=A0A183AK06_9TREM|nr:unnamed protein product [Echinostoma caproni]
MKWIILVLGDRMTHSPEKNILVQQMELIGSSIRANDGFCKMDCTWMETRSLLLDCGLRLPRAEARAQAADTASNQPSNIRIDLPTTSKPIAKPPANQSDESRPKSDGGLLNNVISTLSSAGMHILGNVGNSTAPLANQVPNPKVTDNQENAGEDFIILCEEDNENVDNIGNRSDSINPSATTSSQDDAVGSGDTGFKFDYQPPGSTDSVILTSADLDCLTPGALINDAIINFYLKYLYFEQLSDLQRACTYVFNCFFYSRLSGMTPTPPAANTRSQNTKPEMLKGSVPQSSLAPSHWFLGLVCYPWMAGMVSYTALYQAAAFDMCQLTEQFSNIDSLVGHLNVDDRIICDAPLERLPGDTVGAAFDRWRRQRLIWLRSRGINAIYLQAEWDTRRSGEDGALSFNRDTIRGFSPRVPSQSNLVDCGIYLLHYVEMFFKQPVKSYTKDYFQHEMASWFSEATVGKKRMEIYNVITQLHERSQSTRPSESTASSLLS